MTEVVLSGKACAVNPLKLSPALGGALAFLGIKGSLPLFHGSQGCTAFALVLMVRHFREAIPLQTTAMSEISTILGSADNVEQAIGNIRERAQPAFIGICTTALTETRGEDMVAELRTIRERHPEWADLAVVYASTPDYGGSIEEGWTTAVTATIDALVPGGDETRTLRQVNVLPGSHLTAADVEELREIIESFGLTAVILPDVSDSLDGHVPDQHIPTSLGGTPVSAIPTMGRSVLTLALGEQMRAPAELLAQRTGVPYRLFDRLTGLEPTDTLIATLMEVSGTDAPERLKRERSRLIDTMLDGHFFFDGRSVGIAAEPDLLLALSSLFASLGARVVAAVASDSSPALSAVPAPQVIVGDLDDFERSAAGCDLLVGNSHAADTAARLGTPLFRAGFPVFDRLGAAQRISVGYRGTRQLIVDLANVFMQHPGHADQSHGDGHGCSHTPVTPKAPFTQEDRHAQAQAR